MNKTEITKAQGKCFTKSIHGRTLAVVLDTTSLYTERSSWGKPVRFHKTGVTAVKQDRLGCVETGWLVLHVRAIGWDANYGERIAQAEMFIRAFNGTVEDVLNADGSVNHDNLQADVTVSLVNNRNLFPRPAETPVVDGPVRTQDAGDGVQVVEDARLVVRVAVAEGVTYPWLRADNAAKAYAKEFGNGAKLIRKSAANGIYVYNWS